jgi:UDPglucose 6-dehydrogenase
MKVGIVGSEGVIGSACKYGFEKLGHEVCCHDIVLDTKLIDLRGCDIIYICVPTPSSEDGSCDTSVVEDVITCLLDIHYIGIIAIKSTITPGTTARIQQQSIGHNPGRICFVPEFLRERCAISDFTENHDLLVVGTGHDEVFNKIVECHGKYPKETAMMSVTEAELIKYYSNTYNAMRVVFANTMYEVCDSLGADYQKIKDTFVKRGTVKDLYLDVNENFRGYGGMCLPKDNAAMAALVKERGLNLDLFDCIEKENKKFKTTVFEGMRI